jgi:hypothetical protein
MRALSILVIAALVAAVPSVATARPKPAAELVVKGVTASLTGGQIAVGANVKNKGSKKAKASTVAFFLSADAKHSADDRAIGTSAVGKVRPKKVKRVSGTFAVPTGLAQGSYRMVACADIDGKVKERKETNNCKAAPGLIAVGPPTVTPPVIKKITITWSVTGGLTGTGGFVSVSGSAPGGTCTADGPSGSCTADAGASTVTLTATSLLLPFINFLSWSAAASSTCDGTTSGGGGSVMTFTDPTADKSCVANFNSFP